MNKTVAFILSSGHSGSTLLGSFLHAHSQIMHIGEIPAPIQKKYPYQCLYCGDESACPIFDDVLSESFIRNCYRGYLFGIRANKHAKRRYLYQLAVQLNKPFGFMGKPGDLYSRLFAKLPHIDCIIDSSKGIKWAQWNSGNSAYRSVYIFLWRDLRALVAGGLRREHGSIEWVAQREAKRRRRFFELCDSLPPQNSLTIKYEDLASTPELIGQRVCDFLGIEYQPDMIDFYKIKNHIWGGNPSIIAQSLFYHDENPSRSLDRIKEVRNRVFYEKQPLLGFRKDNRWRNELTDEMLQGIEPIIGELNHRSGYSVDL